MHIENYLDVIDACRFCFMCRHIATTANVTFREADIPRGRALILDRIRMNPELLANPDYIKTLYDCALSAACRKHCVSGYDETGLVLAARRDVVDADLAPDDVNALADALQADFAPTRTGQAGDILYLDTANQEDISTAFGQLMDMAGLTYTTLHTNDTGKALAVLGFTQRAARMAQTLADQIAASGCTTVVTSCPAAFDALQNDFSTLGVDLGDVTLQHTSSFLLGLVQDGRLEPQARTGQTACLIDSDFLRNYNECASEPKALLETRGFSLKPFGTNPEESYALGEGAVVFDALRPDLVRRMRNRFAQLMDSPDDLIITASPYTRRILASDPERAFRVMSLEEAIAN